MSYGADYNLVVPRMNILTKPKSTDRTNAESVDRDGLLATISRLQPDEACAKLASTLEGLSETEADARLKKFGPNIVARERKATILEELWGRARNPLTVSYTHLRAHETDSYLV